jgi:hypothetical protein
MRKATKRIILFGLAIFFACNNVYAEDKKKDYDYQQPNYNDPSKPNYMRGTRTDMAPKVEVRATEEETTRKHNLSKGQEMLIRTIVPRNTIGERVKNVGKSVAVDAAQGAAVGGKEGAAVGAVGGALKGTAEEVRKDVKWIFTGKKEN